MSKTGKHRRQESKKDQVQAKEKKRRMRDFDEDYLQKRCIIIRTYNTTLFKHYMNIIEWVNNNK